VGAGKVGQTLGRLANEAGYEIGEVICLSHKSAAAAVKFIGAGVPQSITKARISAPELILISTPDDLVGEAAISVLHSIQAGSGSRPRSDSPHSKFGSRQPVVLHTSGALSSDVLLPLRAAGLSTGSCHPLQTFESPASAMRLIQQSFFCIEGDRRAVAMASRLVKALGAKSFRIPTELKSLYHASAVLASGGIVALLSICLEAFSKLGIDQTKAMAVLMPLVKGTVENVSDLGPVCALTGPIRRGDTSTVRANLEALKAADPDWARIYAELGKQSVRLVQKLKEPARNLTAVSVVLDNEMSRPEGTTRPRPGRGRRRTAS